eukprot:1946331-Prymnesium_polylepis.2
MRIADGGRCGHRPVRPPQRRGTYLAEPGPGRHHPTARSGPSRSTAHDVDEHALTTLKTQDTGQSTPQSRPHDSDDIACMHGSVH